MQVEIYVDLACPWSYMGKRHFEWALAAFEREREISVILQPYLLGPEGSSDAGNDASVRAAASGGIDYRPDQVVPTDTLPAHRLISHRVPLVEIAEAFRLLETKEGGVMKVIVEP